MAVGVGLGYVAYVAKKRFAKVEQSYKHDDFAGMVAAATGQSDKPQPLPDWKPAPAEVVSSAAGKVPLRVSLRLINAGTDALLGDYESVFEINSLTQQAVHIKASQQFPPGQGWARLLGGGSDKQKLNNISCGRTIFRADLLDSAETDGYFCVQGRDERHPGTTAMGFSKRTLNELRTTGQAVFTFHEDPLKTIFKSIKKTMESGSDSSASDNASMELLNKLMSLSPVAGDSQAMQTTAVKCTLRREGNTDLAFPVLVNDQPAQLPVMHVVCKPPDSDNEAHMYVLDDPENALVMYIAGTRGGHEQIIKIYWDADTPSGNGLAQELEKNGRAKVYDLYFDFRKDVLRPESQKVLTEIAQVMRQHPDWKLSVEGHTDNIGGDAFNLDLSKRRAAAVKQALVGQFHVAADRLSTDGFGASRPVDTNATLEGRARNRRVELARQ
ncbi:MAG TPA: OmpA family protein [Candidatus Sulfotelmatobacter sp.]|nr:OmpA family protein [Candidatus Sulfotelmatobacter sp.]